MFVVEQDTYLEHFGIRGMKWGIRNKTRSEKTPEQKTARNKKIAIGVGLGAVGVGAAFLVHHLKKSGNIKLKNISNGRSTMDITAMNKSLLDMYRRGLISDGVDLTGTGRDSFGRVTRSRESIIKDLEDTVARAARQKLIDRRRAGGTWA